MKGPKAGLTLLEVIISVAIISITALIYLQLERNSWSGSTNSARINTACHLIESRIEALRIAIYAYPTTCWPPRDSSMTQGPIRMSWVVDTALSKTGAQLAKVRKLRIVARWTNPRTDSVDVTTYLAKDF